MGVEKRYIKREKKKIGIHEVTHLTALIMTDIPSSKTQHSRFWYYK